MSKKEGIATRLEEILRGNYHSNVKLLLGELLTITDSITSDPVQRKAMKNLVEGVVWRKYYDYSKDLEYYLEKLANAINEDSLWKTQHDKGVVTLRKAYNPLTAK